MKEIIVDIFRSAVNTARWK